MRLATLCPLGAVVVACAGCGGGSERDASERVPPGDRRVVAEAARAYTDFYFGPLNHGTATPGDLARLRTVTKPHVFEDLRRAHAYAARQRRRSAYARRKLDARPTCKAGYVRITPRPRDRVLAEVAWSCDGRRASIGWGLELAREAPGRWVVVSERDARFDRDRRCIAKSCRSPEAPYDF